LGAYIKESGYAPVVEMAYIISTRRVGPDIAFSAFIVA